MASFLSMAYLPSLALGVLIVMIGAVNDARHFRIPNSVSLSLLILFPVFALSAPVPPSILENLGLGFVVLITGFVLYTKGLVGAGDIKLLSALTLWAGPDHVLVFLFVTACAGGVVSILYGVRAYWVGLRATQTDPAAPLPAHVPVPYGLAIAAGGLHLFYLLSLTGKGA